MSLMREISNLFKTINRDKSFEDIFNNDFDHNSLEVKALTEKLNSYLKENSNDSLNFIIKTIALNRRSASIGIDSSEFVATIPNFGLKGLRGTFTVIEELLRNAKSEVITFGYEINDKEIIKLFHNCSAQELDLLFVTDRERETGKKLFKNWPECKRMPQIYEDTKCENSAIYSKMHSKLILVDREKLLLSSANFTFHGMEGNIEFGILLSGEAVKTLREFLINLLKTEVFTRVL
jgi:phosphatidylserine/phosphatidylglycerophosphate/cardiolipin synthase-like enzyme